MNTQPNTPASRNEEADAWNSLLAYVLQDELHNRLTPRVIDIAYTAFMIAKQPNTEDGGSSDWFNDAKPVVQKAIEKLRAALAAPGAAIDAGGQEAKIAPVPYDKHEAEVLAVVDERDRYHDMADQLAAQIAAITGDEIGEHSSDNDPWHNAMLSADEWIARDLRAMFSGESEPHLKKFRDKLASRPEAPPASASSATVAQPEFFTVFALYEDGGETGWIALPGYSNETEHGVKNLVLEAARKEGYKGTATGRLQELGWEIRPVYAAPTAPNEAVASERPCRNCDDTGDVHSITGEWRGVCHCPAGQHIKARRLAAPVEQAGAVAVLRFERGAPGRENDMPRVVSCNWQPDGEYPVYLAAQPCASQGCWGAAEGYEHYAAIRDGHRNAAEDAWFKAFPNLEPHSAFQVGFDAGYNTRDAVISTAKSGGGATPEGGGE